MRRAHTLLTVRQRLHVAVDLHARGTRVLVSDIVELAVHLTVEVTLFRCAQDIEAYSQG